MLFQFTPLREGRRCPAARSTSAPIFQFTPLREGRRSALIGTSFGWMISIHAPPRGATRSLYRALALSAYFNSRPSARGDAAGRARVLRRIHFNSRPSARGDGITLACKPHALVFQFTPLREGRRTRFLCCAHQFYFNSRPSARGDFARLTILYTRLKFQFTPLREGRRHPACQTSIAS